MGLIVNKALSDLLKLDPLDETKYRCWSQKLLIFFKQLEVDYVLFFNLTKENHISITNVASAKVIDKNKTKPIDEITMRKLKKDNKTFRRHLLNHMTNPLFNLFVTFKPFKITWEKSEVKYGADDIEKKKYVVSEWLSLHIADDKSIMEQVHVYENICAEVLNENMKMCKILKVNNLIEKFRAS